MKCIYCSFECAPSGFGSHACKKAPPDASARTFKTSGSRLLTMQELQDSRIESGLAPSPRLARELRKATPRGTCVACGCTDGRACMTYAGPCHWVDREHLLCSGCFAPLAYSSADDNIRAIRKETRMPLLRRARLVLLNNPGTKTRVDAINVRLRTLRKAVTR